METIVATNVCEAYARGMSLISSRAEIESSRNGDVYVMQCPVTTVYSRPEQRVLFDEHRDANPFFHLMESVWMLAGSDDGRWLDRYVRDFSSRFAEDGGHIHGAYGMRWRHHFTASISMGPIDQIMEIGRMLHRDPTTRRAVMSMWDAEVDLGADVRDMPCNTHIYFRGRPTSAGVKLDMTVCNRSNDIIWGAYGANAVHMSVLHEVMAGLAGLQMGRYYQISNNYHAYRDVFDGLWARSIDESGMIPLRNLYLSPSVCPQPIVLPHNPTATLTDAETFVIARDAQELTESDFITPFFRETVLPMHRAHTLWRDPDRETDALVMVDKIQSRDWWMACAKWMIRRMGRRS